MSTYNDQTDYELMELLGLKDLRNSRLVLAEIVTVNRTNKTASVTIVEECPELENESLTAVPFFYHCEYSAGTVEDLEDGHKAFRDGDTVYCVFVPENGDQVKQFYIVGHVDIRKTVMCASKDFLLIRFSYTINSVSYDFVTVYDPETNSKLDLENFVNLDENSPAKPVSLPAPWSSISSWFAYNFTYNNTSLNISGSIACAGTSKYPDIWVDWTTVPHTWNTVLYSGMSYGLCSTFDTGNAAREYSDVWEGFIEDYGFVGNDMWASRKYGYKNNGVTKYELGDTYCRAYWSSGSAWDSYEVQGIYKHVFTVNSKGSVIYVDLLLDWFYEDKITIALSGDTTEIETTTYSYTRTISYKTYLDFSVLGRYSDELSLAYSAVVNGTLNTPPSWNNAVRDINVEYSYSSTQAQGAFPTFDALTDANGDSLKYTPWYTTMNSVTTGCKQGSNHLYMLFGGASIEEWYSGTNHSITKYTDTSVFPGALTGQPNIVPENRFFKLIGKSSTSIAILGDHIPKNAFNQYYLIDCIQNTNESMSRVLNSVIDELYTYIWNFHNYSNSQDVDRLWNVIKPGPSSIVYDKKFM